MAYKDFLKEVEQKKQEDGTMSSLKNQLKALTRSRSEYIDMAREQLKKGNESLYNTYVALLKANLLEMAKTQDMIANLTIAIEMRRMNRLNANFVKTMNKVMKDVNMTSNIDVKSSQKLFGKAMSKHSYNSSLLQKMLEENGIEYKSTVDSVSKISDAEIRAVVESEIQKEDASMEESLSKLEEQFLKPKQSQIVADTNVVGKGQPVAVVPPKTIPAKPYSENYKEEINDEVSDDYELPDNKPDNKIEKSDDNVDGSNGNSGTLNSTKLSVAGAAFRPQRLVDYIGQPNAVATLSDPIKKAKLMDKPLPHVLLCGSYGQGKTTLAKIISNEIGGRFIEVTPAVNSRDLLRILRNVKKGDIIFIDEVHKLKTEIIESMLYPAMEDFELHYTESNSQHTNSKTQKIEPFTLIGATTETGKLLKPFYSKFPINVTLCEYKLETIATIIKNSFRVRGINISDELCFEVANRSRLSPRMANAHVEGIASSAIVKAAEQKNIEGRGALNSKEAIEALHITITKDDVLNYFNKLGIDERGLKEDERKILRVLIEMYNGGPTGQENIAKALNIATNRVDQEYEPYLVKLGFINIRPQGRYATEAAYEYLGIKNENAKANESKTDEVQDDNGTQDDSQKQDDSKNEIIEDDELPVIECAIGEFDQKSADRFIELFSGEGEQSDKSLDELFPDVDKTYDSIAANRCVLKVGSRELYCDSKLERRFISYLFKKGFITDAKSEALELEYSSDSMSGKRYFPDFVLKLYDGRIAVVELKNLSSVGYHLNIAKYEALKSYCAENGYLYAEVAKDYESDRYVSAEQLKAKEVNNELKKFVYDKIENNGICTAEDLKNGMFANVDIVNLLLNDRSLKNIDRTGAHPQIVGTSE